MKDDNILKFIKEYSLILAVIFFLSLFLTDFVLLSENIQKTSSNSGDVLKISEIDGPMISSEGVFDQKKENVSTYECTSFSISVWASLLFAYVAVLIFNLSYDFGKSKSPQWFWEAFFTTAFFVIWLYFDKCKESVWFPLYVLKIGIITYLSYLHFFVKKFEEK